MSKNNLVSIIVNNYNYGRFLRHAIDSAIKQKYSNVEVIVVDDGSTDESAAIIAEYGNKIIAISKENGGQASAFNAGFEASHGEIVIFLDSDDILLPTAATKVVALFEDSNVSKVHWPLWEINEVGQKKGGMFPQVTLCEGDLLEEMAKYGPNGYTSSPTSGNAWSRKFLEQVLPVPADSFKISADSYLFMLAPLFGLVRLIKEPQSFYRIHSKNNYKGNTLKEETLVSIISQYDTSCLILKSFLDSLAISADTRSWKDNSWFYKLRNAVNDIKNVIPADKTFILVDEDQWEAAGEVAGRKSIPFVEHDGTYWGPPGDDAIAIREIERQQNNGASFIVFAWPAFWLLSYYSQMDYYLHSNYTCIMRNENVIVFDLDTNASAKPERVSVSANNNFRAPNYY
ncbi:glycosyltransferase family 2 protein [Segetibacter koreensis]|uniref:glycosyltransferase family 2 protein n=1 Tax=Segetibacter koreensis TaxID=398037 RepID=UPI00037B2FCB|nr:glycosyltransferase family A protein [Segetibacter koreensis]